MEEKTYKVGVPNWTIVQYKGANIIVQCGPYWTTTKATSERQAKLNAMKNLLVKIAKGEIFTWGNVRQWVNIRVDLSDMVIGG